MNNNSYILTLSCHDIAGIVASVSGFLLDNQCFIIESTQFGDPSTCKFFMRVVFSNENGGLSHDEIKSRFSDIAKKFNMEWNLNDSAYKMRLLLMVSKQGHCLNDLLHRYASGSLPVEIPAVISNHKDMEKMVKWYDIPFYHLPVDANSKQSQEAKILKIIDELKIDLTVLARYMQVLSPDLSDKLRGRAINIHHSFLPGFKGAKPYHQAYDRGVKIIGATAHYVTEDLDEGPIIEQEVIRVNHAHSPEQLLALGKDVESLVLSKAIKYHIEHRVILNGNKTIVF
jgi:formyltetrahydrofolate deformylase